jgi:hypothetical protein
MPDQDISTTTIELVPSLVNTTDNQFRMWTTTNSSDVPWALFNIVAEVQGSLIELPYNEKGFEIPSCS